MSIMSWMEMAEEDQPPESIWMNDEAIAEHFENVKRKYTEKASGMESVPEGTEMQDNEIVRQLMR